ncbi:pathogenesis-related protein PRB1-3-like [Aristolochia californica]|uniref:pathogenesis-related protein PRB1-3-like n=1 Tax=Aristolochia californica TaxID=171875 RepID=UPI0035D8E736
MAIKLLLGTFLILSSIHPFVSSLDEINSPRISRRMLAGTPSSTTQQYLAPHNRVRAKLGLPALRWSEQLASYSLWWGKQRKGDCALIHSSGNYGENIFWGSGRNWKPADAVNAWAAEQQYYDRGSNKCLKNKDCLHYTQLVWKQSAKVGCAKVICGRGDTYITCNYDPHGNVMGQRPY